MSNRRCQLLAASTSNPYSPRQHSTDSPNTLPALCSQPSSPPNFAFRFLILLQGLSAPPFCLTHPGALALLAIRETKHGGPRCSYDTVEILWSKKCGVAEVADNLFYYDEKGIPPNSTTMHPYYNSPPLLLPNFLNCMSWIQASLASLLIFAQELL